MNFKSNNKLNCISSGYSKCIQIATPTKKNTSLYDSKLIWLDFPFPVCVVDGKKTLFTNTTVIHLSSLKIKIKCYLTRTLT